MKQDDKIVSNSPRPLTKDLDALPSPDYETTVHPLAGVAVDDTVPRRPPLHAGRAFAAFVAQFDAP